VVEGAWKQYIQEQRWGRIRGISEEGSFGNGSTHGEIISHTFALIHPDFRSMPLKSLGLERGVQSRIIKGFSQVGLAGDFETIEVFNRTDRFFGALPGVGSVTVDRLRKTLLEFSYSWRWQLAGIDRRAYRVRPVSAKAREELIAGLEELKGLF
jgi:hypothetical protein